ncbi:P2X purinoceptor 7-like [Trichosurus vulpecula]|uniref:P2X purinoceptor 7-like n=1 Tax=Trichosurus vulpecula TaxID=9337 RepID=UPI00186B1BC4|nr:P2X purinoceptor 7-like [Trichosurus vulpecula]
MQVLKEPPALMAMRCQRDWCYSSSLFSIKTEKVVEIQNVWYGTLKWLISVLVLIYICFGLWSEKLYQRKEPLISSVHTKIKGIAEVTEGNKTRVLDPADYTFPLQGNSFFVITNFLTTEGQRQGICPEFPTNKTCCSSDQDCKKGRTDPLSKGVPTGKCIKYNLTSYHPKTRDLPEICQHQKTCEVSAWCPVEPSRETPQPALLASAENFTVLLKNSIHFPGHNYSTRNIHPGMDISCTFHKTFKPDCPIFRLGDILQETGENFSSMAIYGGIVGIEIYWDCNLDAWSHSCSPKYSFRRLDDKKTNKSSHPENGWLASVLSRSFRYAKYYMEGGREKRTLIKVFGIQFDILVFGTGGKFDIIQLIVYMGSTISYFGLATVLIDFLIQMYTKNCCRSWFYPCCKVCEPCSVNEYYYERKCETIGQPVSTLKYVSFVDEPNIRMINQDSLRKSLQDVEGEEVPRPQKDFIGLDKLSPSPHPETSPSPVSPEEMQLPEEEPGCPSHSRPEWCRCGHCRPSQLSDSSRFTEELCCRRTEGPCITTSAIFEELVLSKSTLRFILLYQDPLLEVEAVSLNDQLRHCAYRRYIDWRFGSEDMAGFAIMPSCCRWKIRKRFPKKNAKYAGFRSPNRYNWSIRAPRRYSSKDSSV